MIETSKGTKKMKIENKVPVSSDTNAARQRQGKILEYAPSLESTSVVKIDSKYQLYINGKWVAPTTGKYFETTNPATNEKLSDLAEAGDADVDKAVKAARQAYNKTWSKMSGKDRGKYLFRIARLIQERSREFAVLETLDNGKPIKESRDIDIPLEIGRAHV